MIFVVSGVLGQNNLKNYGYTAIALINYSCFSDAGLKRLHEITRRKEPNPFSLNKMSIPQQQKNLFFYNYNLIKPTVIIAPNFYTQNFGFFCKKEVQLQKAIKVPFVFRLGSVEMCDRLEGRGKY